MTILPVFRCTTEVTKANQDAVTITMLVVTIILDHLHNIGFDHWEGQWLLVQVFRRLSAVRLYFQDEQHVVHGVD